MSFMNTLPLLAGDIGGTKTNLALYSMAGGDAAPLCQKQYPSTSFSTFEAMLNDFLATAQCASVQAACFGMAGPVIDGVCKTTNLPWIVEEAVLRKQLGTPRVRLINDLEATAYGMLYLDKDQLVDLNPHARPRTGNIAVIAAGTGLGEAMLLFDGSAYHPVGSEGGHTDFAPLDARQDALLQWLRSRYPEHVSYERILSGSGIQALYDYVRESGFAPECDALANSDGSGDRSALISHCALNENDPLSVETLRLFARIYGAEAGNLALKAMSLGGIYIGGGIAPKILPFLQEPSFLESIVAKGRFREMLECMPVRVSLDSETALLGALQFASDKLLT